MKVQIRNTVILALLTSSIQAVRGQELSPRTPSDPNLGISAIWIQQCHEPLLSTRDRNLSTQDEPFYLRSQRLILRSAYGRETESVHQILSNPEIERFYLDSRYWILDRTFEFMKNRLTAGIRHQKTPDSEFQGVHFVIENARTGELIGTGSVTQYLKPDAKWLIGYAIRPSARRQGFASETVRTLIDFIRERFPQADIQLRIFADNDPSIALAKRLGFVLQHGPFRLLSGQPLLEFRLPAGGHSLE